MSCQRKYFRRLLVGFLSIGILSFLWPVDSEIASSRSVDTVNITDKDGVTLRLASPDGIGINADIEQLPPFVIQALIATEDKRFHSHFGIDPLAIVESMRINVSRGEVVRGASTISMQVARSLLRSQNRGWFSKIRETHLAVRLEVWFSKPQILSLWLSRVPFGNQTFGIDAASQYYFGKAARNLALDEAALLVGLPQGPSRLNPLRYPDRALTRRSTVLAAMVEQGYLDSAEASFANDLPIRLNPTAQNFYAPHLSERVMEESMTLGIAPVEIRTTIDGTLQRAIEAYAKQHVESLKGRNVGTISAIVLDNFTGHVLAYLGSADYFDFEALGMNDGIKMRRQPGSALKPFLYGYAMQSAGYTTSTILQDTPLQIVSESGAFSPDNYDKKFHGAVSLRRALACSYNVPAVRVAQDLGVHTFWHVLRGLQFTSLKEIPDRYGVGLALGNGEVQLWELARAYSSLARGGSIIEPTTIKWVSSASADTLRFDKAQISSTWMTPATTYLISDILSDNEARAPAFGRNGPLEFSFPVAVKTGTSKDYRDNWAIGYTTQHTVAVWAGNFDGEPMQQVSGVTGAGQLLQSIFLQLGSGGPFIAPAKIEMRHVCSASGMRPHGYCPTIELRPFELASEPEPFCDTHEFARKTPSQLAGGSLLEKGLRNHAAQLIPAHVQSDDQFLRIEYPQNGTRFFIDPVLRPAYQATRLAAQTEFDPDSLRWTVNGAPTRLAGKSPFWQLSKGEHTITVTANDGGRGVYRDSVVVRVISPDDNGEQRTTSTPSPHIP